MFKNFSDTVFHNIGFTANNVHIDHPPAWELLFLTMTWTTAQPIESPVTLRLVRNRSRNQSTAKMRETRSGGTLTWVQKFTVVYIMTRKFYFGASYKLWRSSRRKVRIALSHRLVRKASRSAATKQTRRAPLS